MEKKVKELVVGLMEAREEAELKEIELRKKQEKYIELSERFREKTNKFTSKRTRISRVINKISRGYALSDSEEKFVEAIA